MERRHEVLFSQLKTYREALVGLLKSVSAEEAEIIPEGFRNNIRWNAGHVYLDQYAWIKALTKEKCDIPEGYDKWFGFGAVPSDFDGDTPSLTELVTRLENQVARIRETYGYRLEEKFPPTEMGMETIEQVLIRTIFHERMHLQAIIDIKKCIRLKNMKETAGMDGAEPPSN